jgi:F-type H+-transporting ATPase subunit gamma
MHALDRNVPTAEKGNVVAVGSKLSTTLAGDPRVAAFVDGPSVAEEVEAVLVKLMEALTRLNAARPGSLRITVLHHRADQDDVSMSVLRPFRRADGARAQFAYAPLLNTEPRAFLTGLVEQYLSAMLYELLYSSLMSENQRRMQHMDSAVRRLEKTLGDFLLRRNTLRQEEITEEIEVIMLSIEALK